MIDCSNFSSSSVRESGRSGCADGRDIVKASCARPRCPFELSRKKTIKLRVDSTRGELCQKRCVLRAPDKGYQSSCDDISHAPGIIRWFQVSKLLHLRSNLIKKLKISRDRL